jgi:YHS domain-containing protein
MVMQARSGLASADVDGTTYHFCSQRCRARFVGLGSKAEQ